MTEDIVAYLRKQQNFMQKLCAPAHDYFDVTDSTLSLIKSNGSMKILATNADKVENYFQQKLYQNDPHLVKPQHIESGIVSWFDNTKLFDCKMEYGFSVIIKQKKTSYYSLCCATTSQNTEIYNNLLNEQLFIKLFVNHLINRTESLFAMAPDLDLNKYKKKQFGKQVGITANNAIELTDSIKQYFPELE